MVQELDLGDLTERANVAARPRWPGATVAEVTPLLGGYSSLTYTAALDTGESAAPIVLKVAPPGLPPVKNRDVLRQARLLAALDGADGLRVPGVLFESPGDPPDVPPFFGMTFAEGDAFEPLLDEGEVPPVDVLAERARNAATMLAALQRVDPVAVGLGDEPEVGLADEVGRWRASFEKVDEDLRFDGVEMADRLLATAPPARPSVLLHGDYRLGNMLATGTEIQAIIDWEIWSRGDGRLDLGWYLMMVDPAYPNRARDVPGLPSPDELCAVYERELGRPADGAQWFGAFVAFKQAATTALIVRNARKRGQSLDFSGTIERLLAFGRDRLA